MERIKLAHGSGGTLTHELIAGKIRNVFDSPLLEDLPDSASIALHGCRLAFTTDSYVVDPVFFPGGDIGKLAVFGTVNDLAVSGSVPHFISCALILEAGFAESDLDKILDSMGRAAHLAGVDVVTGDTKVVPAGKADKIFINTAGLGIFPKGARGPEGALTAGDRVIVTGPTGDHGAAVMACREGLNLESNIESDCAPVTEAARTILDGARRVPFMRDITRGGLATVLNEAVRGQEVGIVLDEQCIPVRDEVRSISELLGIDPCYLACEGRVAAVVDGESAEKVVDGLRGCQGAEDAVIAGKVTNDYVGKLVSRTPFGTHRLLQMLSGEQLPRIC